MTTDVHHAAVLPADELATLRAQLTLAQGVAADAREQFLRARDTALEEAAQMVECEAAVPKLTVQAMAARLKQIAGHIRGLKEERQHHSALCPGCSVCNGDTRAPEPYRTDGDTAPDGRLLRGAP